MPADSPTRYGDMAVGVLGQEQPQINIIVVICQHLALSKTRFLQERGGAARQRRKILQDGMNNL